MSAVRRGQVTTFFLLWLAYCSTYLLRKPLGVVKLQLGAEQLVRGAGELLPGCTVTVAALCGVLRGAGTSILCPAVTCCAAAASTASSNNEITAPR